MDKKRNILLWSFLLLSGVLLAQSGEGGGVYLENGGKLAGTLVTRNSSAEGFGVSGGDAVLLNCTVTGNEAETKLRNGMKPGDILCADGSVIDTAGYKARAVKDAIGVVFWVNTDVYNTESRMYVAALKEADKKWGNDGLLGAGYVRPEVDTASYTMTGLMLDKGGSDWEAADYCANFKAEGQPAHLKWAFPTGFQMAMLFVNMSVMNKTLGILKGFRPEVQTLDGELYWSATESPMAVDCAWAINFNRLDNAAVYKTPGTFVAMGVKRNTENTVRPVLVY